MNRKFAALYAIVLSLGLLLSLLVSGCSTNEARYQEAKGDTDVKVALHISWPEMVKDSLGYYVNLYDKKGKLVATYRDETDPATNGFTPMKRTSFTETLEDVPFEAEHGLILLADENEYAVKYISDIDLSNSVLALGHTDDVYINTCYSDTEMRDRITGFVVGTDPSDGVVKEDEVMSFSAFMTYKCGDHEVLSDVTNLCQLVPDNLDGKMSAFLQFSDNVWFARALESGNVNNTMSLTMYGATDPLCKEVIATQIVSGTVYSIGTEKDDKQATLSEDFVAGESYVMNVLEQEYDGTAYGQYVISDLSGTMTCSEEEAFYPETCIFSPDTAGTYVLTFTPDGQGREPFSRTITVTEAP